MTTANFVHIDTSSYTGKPWAKVDGPGTNFVLKTHSRQVNNLRGREHEFTTDNSGFAVYHHPAKEQLFTDDTTVRTAYYAEVESLLRTKLPGKKKSSSSTTQSGAAQRTHPASPSNKSTSTKRPAQPKRASAATCPMKPTTS